MNRNIYPSLWFNGNAREAADLYCSVFPQFTISGENPLVVNIASRDQQLMLINGGPEFTPNPSISFFAVFDSVEELEKAWDKLLEGGSVLMPLDAYPWSIKYGWLQDRYGVNWQLHHGKMAETNQFIIPALMFNGEQNGRAGEAINLYTSVFKESALTTVERYQEGEQDITGNIKHARFSLGRFTLAAMDSSMPHPFAFNEGVSFVVECETQEEIDYYWDKLSEGGSESQCGWLKDRFGVSWQVVPSILPQLMADPARSGRVIQAFLKMKKFDIATLLKA
jgi:predicted 3-demethylubiquinone-9 3-methyltransferase (glyoxalase superfamily)